MSEVEGNHESASSAKASNPTRPMWCLGANGMPVAASSRKIPNGVKAFCYEGDTEWTPVENKHHLSEGGRSL